MGGKPLNRWILRVNWPKSLANAYGLVKLIVMKLLNLKTPVIAWSALAFALLGAIYFLAPVFQSSPTQARFNADAYVAALDSLESIEMNLRTVSDPALVALQKDRIAYYRRRLEGYRASLSGTEPIARAPVQPVVQTPTQPQHAPTKDSLTATVTTEPAEPHHQMDRLLRRISRALGITVLVLLIIFVGLFFLLRKKGKSKGKKSARPYVSVRDKFDRAVQDVQSRQSATPPEPVEELLQGLREHLDHQEQDQPSVPPSAVASDLQIPPRRKVGRVEPAVPWGEDPAPAKSKPSKPNSAKGFREPYQEPVQPPSYDDLDDDVQNTQGDDDWKPTVQMPRIKPQGQGTPKNPPRVARVEPPEPLPPEEDEESYDIHSKPTVNFKRYDTEKKEKADVVRLARRGYTSSEISRRLRIPQDQVEFIIRMERENP